MDLTTEPAVQGLVLTLRDVSERKELEDLLAHQAFHDALTGLPNRALLRDRLAHALYRRGAVRPLGLLFLDLNDFKTVNDSLGHFAGDALLQIVAARLELQLRAGDTAARIGGDEFVILLEDADEAEAVEVAFRIRDALNEPANLVDIDVYPQASIGVAVGHPGVTSAEELLAQADAAMYMAKASEGVCLYGEELRINVLRRLELKTELQRALARGELSVHYQPVIDLATGRIAGVEALARWVHPRSDRSCRTTSSHLPKKPGSSQRSVATSCCARVISWLSGSGPTCTSRRVLDRECLGPPARRPDTDR